MSSFTSDRAKSPSIWKTTDEVTGILFFNYHFPKAISTPTLQTPMIDLYYTTASMAFFALMIIFVWACEKV